MIHGCHSCLIFIKYSIARIIFFVEYTRRNYITFVKYILQYNFLF